ncbi:MAG: GNAT family N-acetyltransferase [Chitinophagaceae bacterium]
MIICKRTDSADPDFRELVALLDKDLAIRDGNEHAFYAQFNKIDLIRNAIVGYLDDQPIACGAFKEYEPGKVEIKRMYVLPEHRGKGIAISVLKELENWAAESKYTACVLETGKKQPEAIRLYQKAGYSLIENYGQYKGIENSFCMQKSI